MKAQIAAVRGVTAAIEERARMPPMAKSAQGTAAPATRVISWLTGPGSVSWVWLTSRPAASAMKTGCRASRLTSCHSVSASLAVLRRAMPSIAVLISAMTMPWVPTRIISVVHLLPSTRMTAGRPSSTTLELVA